ncbi:hypothetical protein [Myxococcus xanthus]|uniref:Lipoprotein n=1 Tax=Myxococcus xanthus TaxID=34 RepID=A0A7Y4IJE6_MYXXA|nr:hypothetical protein [Myxococcus xanthus]NOJ79690.1 hypothetical protein [Myxococcus xanthus]NOJ88529.1 hypothetical protein [Myxococcus xanthus]
MTTRACLRSLSLSLALLLAGPAGSVSAAPKATAPKVTISDIQAQVYDRQQGAIVATDAASDPYGMNVDAFIVVKLQGTYEGDAPLKLTLLVSAPKESSEAAGDRPAWKATQMRELVALAENGVTQVPFILPYHCASKVKVTAILTGSGLKASKTLNTSFPCAE